jgi:DNA-binding GntR family transcriptional regulator
MNTTNTKKTRAGGATARTRRKATKRTGTNGASTRLADRIRQAIEEDILAGRLAPGTKLDEDGLAERHGASRTPVREALQHLASQGLIELRPHAGAYVPTRSVVELAEMFEPMAFLEGACAALAARRHSADDRRLLAAAHDRCAEAAKRDDPVAFYAANRHFHGCIYHAAHNRYLAAQTTQLANRLEAYRREATFHPGLMSLTMAEHERILAAIFAMDEVVAGAQMRSHLDTLRDDVVSLRSAMESARASCIAAVAAREARARPAR